MYFLKLLIIALTHGILEFLPVSSSTHLKVVEHWLGFQCDAFDKLLGVATALTVVIFFRKRVSDTIKGLFSKSIPAWFFALRIIVGCIPAGLMYFLCYKPVRNYLNDTPTAVCMLMVGTGIVLLSTRTLRSAWPSLPCGFGKTLLIGIAQSLALFSGISRSGMTISTGRWLKLSWQDALEFSFLLSVPLVCGDAILGYKDFLELSFSQFAQQAVAAAVACLIGFLSLACLKKIILAGRFWTFSIYLIPAGIAAAIYFLCC